MGTKPKTVLFTDMEASTELSLRRGDEHAVATLHVQEEAVRGQVAHHGGTVLKNTGDGFLAVFATCDTGVRAALAIRDRIDAHNRSNPDTPLGVRLGLHTGPLIEESGDVFGLTVSTAARVTSKALAGQVLVSDDIRLAARADDEWTFTDRGSFWLKGLTEKWRLHEVTPIGEHVSTATGTTDDIPFVGRDAERALLRRSLDATDGGDGAFVTVAGNAGSGKTRLVEEVGREAEARGMQFVVGRCFDTQQAEPYAALVDIAESVERAMTPTAFREVLGTSAGEMARLLPHLRDRFDDVGPAAEAGASETRRYFFASVREVLGRLSARRPLVILLDDLQWADAPTLLFVEYLADELADLPILVVGTYTLEAVSTSTPLHATLARLHRHRSIESISIEPLSRDEIGQLLGVSGGAEPPAPLVEAVHEATEGNAFFAGEIVRQLVERPGVVTEAGWDPSVTLADLEVPEGVRLVIESRFAKLAPATRTILSTVGLLGRTFSLELLETLVDAPEDELLDAIDEAERVHFIISSVDADSIRFAFKHELIRKTMVSQLSHLRLQRLHGRIADALEEVYAPSLASHAATIASHLEHAGRGVAPERMIRFLSMAGDRAVESAAFEDAVSHFGRALETIPEGDPAARAGVLEGLATAERSLGHLEAALSVWDEALEAFAVAGDRHSVARVALDAALQVAWWRRGADVSRLVNRGLAALDDERSATRGGLLAVSGMLASQSGSYERGEGLLDEALALVTEHHDDRLIGMTLYATATHEFAYQRFHETIVVGLESVEYLRAAGDLWNLANILGYVATAQGWLGRFDEAAELGREGEELARRLGNWSAFVFAEQARCFQDIGGEPSASDFAQRGRRALELGDDMGFAWLASIGHARVGLASFWQGEWQAALAEFEEAADIEVRGATGGHLGRLMLVRAYLDDRSGALELAEAARADFPVLGQPASVTSWGLVASAVEVFALLGADDEAAALAPTMDELEAAGITMRGWDFRLVATLQGIAATCAGDWDRAEERFEQALEVSRRLPMRREEPEVLRFHSRMLLERNGPGDRDEARRLREQAVGGYEELGMPAHAALVRDAP